MASNAQQNVKITLHWLEKSRSQRILWLLEELNLDYELKVYKRDKDMMADETLKEVHALGKSPVITVEAAGQKARAIAESGFIVEYLTGCFGKQLIPKQFGDNEQLIGHETDEWMRYRFFMHYAEGGLMPYLVFSLVVRKIKEAAGAPFFVKPITRAIGANVETSFLNKNFKSNFEFIEEQLKTSSGEFLCGERLTGADIMMIYPLESSKAIRGADYPLIDAYVERVQARAAYKKAVRKVIDTTGEYTPDL